MTRSSIELIVLGSLKCTVPPHAVRVAFGEGGSMKSEND